MRVKRVLCAVFLFLFILGGISFISASEVNADFCIYGRMIDLSNDDLEEELVGAWIWDRDAYDSTHTRPPIVYYFGEDGFVKDRLFWEPDSYDENALSSYILYDESEDEIDGNDSLWSIDGNSIKIMDYNDFEPVAGCDFSIVKIANEKGHTVIYAAGPGGDYCKLHAITDEAYERMKWLNGDDWIDFDFDNFIFNWSMPALKNLNLKFKDSTQISFNWGRDLFKENAAATNSYNVDLAKAAIYLCEGTYHGQEDAEERMSNLGLSDPDSDYYEIDAQTNTSPITAASDVITLGNEQYLFVAVAVRGTQGDILKGDIWDFLTDLRSGLLNVDGFTEPGENGKTFVRNYCENMSDQTGINKNHTILFVTGHSLGATIAGQIAGDLQDEVASQNHIFVYTFASPFYETHGRNVSSYTNIHNLVNTEDYVPNFPLGGKRYGVDHTFKGDGKDALDQHMLTTYMRALMPKNNGASSIIRSSSSQTPVIKVPSTKIAKVKRGKNSIIVKWKKKSGVTGYQIQYGRKSNFKGAKKVTVKKRSVTSKKIKKLKSKKKYYVRVRSYTVVHGKRYYSKWSAKKTVRIK